MHRIALVPVLTVMFATVASSQSGAPPVHVVNLPATQPVTGEELRASLEILTLLLAHSNGVLPPGLTSPDTDQCLVTGVGEIYEVEEVVLPLESVGCNLEAYAAACAAAARRARSDCYNTCELFEVIGGHRPCRGHTRPAIEPFVYPRHCYSPPGERSTVTCVVTGWCSCDP